MPFRVVSSPVVKEHEYTVKTHTGFAQLSVEDINAWRVLEEKVKPANVYLSIDYLIPLFQFYDNTKALLIILVYQNGKCQHNLVAAGAFMPSKNRLGLPLLSTVQSIYLFNSGILLDPEDAEEGIARLLMAACARTKSGIVKVVRSDLALSDERILARLKSKSVYSQAIKKVQHLVMLPESSGDTFLQGYMSKSRKKDIRRNLTKLKALGELEWVLVKSSAVQDRHLQTFLNLEDDGWKGENGSSLKSNPKAHQFFVEAFTRLAKRGMVFFTELHLNGEVIASTCNFKCGNYAFAFKLGRLAAYDKYGVGILNEYFIVQQLFEQWPEVNYLDSAVDQDSFLRSFWRDTIDLEDRIFTANRFIYLGYALFHRVKKAIKKNSR